MNRNASKQRVTLRDVARVAGVSMMSVSNVVNGRFGAMKPGTRQRIEAAIESLGYRPHVGARSLRHGKRFSLALLIVDQSPAYLAEPWMTDLVAGLTHHLIGRDYGLYIQGVDAQSVAQTSLLNHVTTDGLCVMLSGPMATRRRILERVMETRQPVVLIQEVLEREMEDVCVVRQGDRDGARDLGRLILDAGPRRIAFLTTSWEWPSVAEREAGIRDAIAERAMRAEVKLDSVACGNGRFEPTIQALGSYIEAVGMPDAIMAGSDTMAVAALRHLAVLGVTVPEQVQVTGFGDFDIRHLVEPALTTVRSPAFELGEKGAEALLARLETGRFAQPEILFPLSVVPGGSTLPAD